MVKPLMDMSKIPNNPVTGVLFAASLLPHKQMFDHAGTYDPTGKHSRSFPSSAGDLGSWKPHPPTLSSDGITHPGMQKAWFFVANGQWDALKQVGGMAKRSGEVGEQATLLLDRAAELLRREHAAWSSRTLDVAAYEDGLALLDKLSGHPAFKEEAKAVDTALKAAAKDALKDEIIARNAWKKVAPLSVSIKKTERDQAKAGLNQIADRFGSTVYGGLAREQTTRIDASTR